MKVRSALGHLGAAPPPLGQQGGMHYGNRQYGALDNKKPGGGRGKKASVPFIFIIMFIEFGSKGAEIKGCRRDS